MTSANTIAFNVGSPSVKGPNGGFINGVKFSGPTTSGKFWIAATSAKAKPGSTREPNGKEKAELLAAFTAAMKSHGELDDDAKAFIEVVEKVNAPAVKVQSEAAQEATDTPSATEAAPSGDVAAAETSSDDAPEGDTPPPAAGRSKAANRAAAAK